MLRTTLTGEQLDRDGEKTARSSNGAARLQSCAAVSTDAAGHCNGSK